MECGTGWCWRGCAGRRRVGATPRPRGTSPSPASRLLPFPSPPPHEEGGWARSWRDFQSVAREVQLPGSQIHFFYQTLDRPYAGSFDFHVRPDSSCPLPGKAVIGCRRCARAPSPSWTTSSTLSSSTTHTSTYSTR